MLQMARAGSPEDPSDIFENHEPQLKDSAYLDLSFSGKKKLDILAGDTSNIKIWVDYVEAHNQRDLVAIDETNADDLVGKAANGVIVNGSAEHAAFLKNWFETSNPIWEFVYAMANDVPQADGSIHHWVTSSYEVTDTIDGKEIVSRESFDVRIENNKIKEIIVASRLVLPE